MTDNAIFFITGNTNLGISANNENLYFWQDGEVMKMSMTLKDIIASQKVFDKLDYYTNLDKQGRLIILPCKIGDTVWVKTRRFKHQPYEIIKCRVINMRLLQDGKTITFTCKGSYSNGRYYTGNFRAVSIGKTVFLTETEALERMTNDEQKR